MRTLFVTSALAALVAVVSLAAPGRAHAEEDRGFEVKQSHGEVKLIAHGSWHINKDYPWRLTVGDAKFDKSKFKLEEKEAIVAGAPKGAGKLKGAICSGDTCKPLEVDVTVL